MDKLNEGFKGAIDGLRGDMNSRFDKVEDRLQNVEIELTYIKDKVNGLKADLSSTPSCCEFNELKARIEKSYPLS